MAVFDWRQLFYGNQQNTTNSNLGNNNTQYPTLNKNKQDTGSAFTTLKDGQTVLSNTGKLGMGFDIAGNVANLGMGIANTVAGFQQLDLAKKQFNMEKALANRNLFNQAQQINSQVRAVGNLAAQQAGHSKGTDNYNSFMQDYRSKNEVNGSPVG